MNKSEILSHLKQKKTPIHVLFVCSGNILRSAFAELYFEKILADKHGKTNLVIESGALTYMNDRIAYETKKFLLKEGVSKERIKQFRSRHVDNHPDLFNRADIIFGMTNGHLSDLKSLGYGDKSFHINEFAFDKNFDIADPFFSGGYGESFTQVKAACDEILKIFEKEGIMREKS
ncbi:MAG: arsenate reductase/protein-tyrosine-phosphatase family protein [Candidatus Helarchaeota archaeon]